MGDFIPCGIVTRAFDRPIDRRAIANQGRHLRRRFRTIPRSDFLTKCLRIGCEVRDRVREWTRPAFRVDRVEQIERAIAQMRRAVRRRIRLGQPVWRQRQSQNYQRPINVQPTAAHSAEYSPADRIVEHATHAPALSRAASSSARFGRLAMPAKISRHPEA
jgi:hypothetical protein